MISGCKKQKDKRELIHEQGLELFKSCLGRVNVLIMRQREVEGEGEERERESTGRIREVVSLYSHPRCGKNMVMGVGSEWLGY